ncbi:unnamed protein product [Urochloa humidicola]
MKSDMEGAVEIAGLDYSDDHVLHAPSLRFSVGENLNNEEEASRRLIASVDAALARRVADVEALEINFVYSSRCNRYISLPSRGCWYV